MRDKSTKGSRIMKGLMMSVLACLLLGACAATPSTPTAAQPTRDFGRTSWEDLGARGFRDLHSPFNGSANESLIFGSLETAASSSAVPAPLQPFMGRWEGYDYGYPVPKDIKVVLLVQDISVGQGTALLWAGTNLQKPRDMKKVHFKVDLQPDPVLYWRATWPDAHADLTFRFDPASGRLMGLAAFKASQGFEAEWDVKLTRDRTFTVCRDYPAWLAEKGIHARAFENPDLARYGAGYLEYLPPGYDPSSSKEWPLIFFLCGTGDRGTDIELLAKASPFMYIRQGHSLPCIIAAPGLRDTRDYRSFPTAYMRGVLEELFSRYRVDRSRVLVTGLSMGGEATIRFVLSYPELVAAAAPLSFGDIRYAAALRSEGFEVLTRPYSAAAAVPFYYVNGGMDPIIPPEAVKKTVTAMKEAGIDVTWKYWPDHGHDVWTDTYSDPAFYEWLLAKHR
jgi:dienelactone hydrolase